MGYNPLTYWQGRGINYGKTAIPIDDRLSDIFAMANEYESILDIGSGWGRAYTFFRGRGYKGRFRMCDIADSMREGCAMETGILPDKWDGIRLPYQNDEFACALLIQVLLHSPSPGTILAEAKRVAGKVIVFDATTMVTERARHCFYRDWFALFARCGVEVQSCTVYDGGRRVTWELA